MDFALSEEQGAIFDMAYEFGQEHIAPFARQWEAEGTIPRDLWHKVGLVSNGAVDRVLVCVCADDVERLRRFPERPYNTGGRRAARTGHKDSFHVTVTPDMISASCKTDASRLRLSTPSSGGT